MQLVFVDATPTRDSARRGDPVEHAGRLGALYDQRLAAALMMGEGTVVFLALAVWLGVATLRDAERRQSLLDAGVDVRRASRAVRYGR